MRYVEVYVPVLVKCFSPSLFLLSSCIHSRCGTRIGIFLLTFRYLPIIRLLFFLSIFRLSLSTSFFTCITSLLTTLPLYVLYALLVGCIFPGFCTFILRRRRKIIYFGNCSFQKQHNSKTKTISLLFRYESNVDVKKIRCIHCRIHSNDRNEVNELDFISEIPF